MFGCTVGGGGPIAFSAAVLATLTTTPWRVRCRLFGSPAANAWAHSQTP